MKWCGDGMCRYSWRVSPVVCECERRALLCRRFAQIWRQANGPLESGYDKCTLVHHQRSTVSRSLRTGWPDEMSQAKQSTGHTILHIVGRSILSPMPYSEGFLQVDVNMGSYFCILFPFCNNSIHHPNDKTPELCCPYLTMRFMRPPQ